MSDAYRILGLAPDRADDHTVRAAYLKELRAHPPERDPEGFQRLRDAYEQLRSHRRRLQHALFHQQKPTLDELAERLLEPGPPRRPSVDEIRRALAAGLGMS